MRSRRWPSARGSRGESQPASRSRKVNSLSGHATTSAKRKGSPVSTTAEAGSLYSSALSLDPTFTTALRTAARTEEEMVVRSLGFKRSRFENRVQQQRGANNSGGYEGSRRYDKQGNRGSEGEVQNCKARGNNREKGNQRRALHSSSSISSTLLPGVVGCRIQSRQRKGRQGESSDGPATDPNRRSSRRGCRCERPGCRRTRRSEGS